VGIALRIIICNIFVVAKLVFMGNIASLVKKCIWI